jgi:hypothetical protein
MSTLVIFGITPLLENVVVSCKEDCMKEQAGEGEGGGKSGAGVDGGGEGAPRKQKCRRGKPETEFTFPDFVEVVQKELTKSSSVVATAHLQWKRVAFIHCQSEYPKIFINSPISGVFTTFFGPSFVFTIFIFFLLSIQVRSVGI